MMDKVKHVATQADAMKDSAVMLAISATAGVNIGAVLDWVHTGVAILVSAATFVWVLLRIEKMLHERRNRRQESDE